DEENAQLVADAVNAHDYAIVDLSEFAGKRCCLDLDDVLSAVGNGNGNALGGPDRDIARFDEVAVAPHRYLRRAFTATLVLHPIGDRLRLANDTKARRREQRDAPVALVLVTGDERVHRRGKPQ